MSLFHVLGFGVKIGQLFWTLCCWFVSWFIDGGIEDKSGLPIGSVGDPEKTKMTTMKKKNKMCFWNKISSSGFKIPSFSHHLLGSVKFGKTWWRKLVVAWVVFWVLVSFWTFWYFSSQAMEKRKETLASMCDERARMLQDQFNVSMNHVQAMSILISTFHHGKIPSAIDQRTFSEYTDRTSFERPLTSGVAYAMRVLHFEREEFERQQGWTIRRMDSLEHKPVHKDDYDPEALEPAPVQEEYAPVIFAQDTVSHVVSLDMLSGKEDRENVLRARKSGKGVLTAPFPLLKTNRLGVILTFAVYKRDLPSNATPRERIEATNGYLGGVFDIESLVENLLHQLASKQTILVNVYDTTNHSQPISMYGSNVFADGLELVSPLNFGDPFRKHEMRCRFKQKPPWPVLSMVTSFGILVIALLVAHIFHATVSRINKVEENCNKMKKLKKKAEAADDAKSQFLATVSHEIRTPMNGVLGMLHMLMDTELDVTQQDYVRTAQASGKALVSLINEVLDQAKIESGKLELEEVCFDLRGILDDVLSLFSGKSQQKGVELAVYISDRVPEMLIGDPGRFRQILTNLMGNSIKFTEKGHIFVTVHLVEELIDSIDVETASSSPESTLSGLPVADRKRSWENFKAFSSSGNQSFPPSSSDINLIVSVEDTGIGIPLEAQSRIFTPFMQVGPSISRTHGGTGIGLSISKCLVGLMKGEIGFSSIPKVGSTFTFTAVFANGMHTAERKSDPHNNNQPIFSEFQGMKAVVVDHRPARAQVSWYHFQRLGIRVEVVPRFDQALHFMKNGTTTVNMILIEQEIWNREADAFIKKLQKDPLVRSPKLILLANSIETSISDTLSTSIDPPMVIVKPLRASMLAATLQRGLGIGNRETPHPALVLRNLLLGRKILIVDDNNVNLRVAAGALKKYGADVVCSESGIKAISLLTPPHEFDACFMDIQMPEMDGFEATRRIRKMEEEMNKRMDNKTRWHLPVLAMTADVIQATHEKCLKSGMDGYVSKPFEARQLYREVSRFFDSPSDTDS